MRKKYLTLLAIAAICLQCHSPEKPPADFQPNPIEPMLDATLAVKKTPFGETPEGAVEQFTLTNANGMMMSVITYGGIITHLTAPDRDSVFEDVVLGFDNLEGYLGRHPYFGAIIGRYGNRIGGASFSVGGKTYQVASNNGPNHLHGGVKGFDKYLWQGVAVQEEGRVGVRLQRTSPDMEEGYPGNLEMTVTYLLDNDNKVWMTYEATTDKPTICNLTNHSYFNLKGAGNGDILDHQVKFSSSMYTPVDETLIPTGEIATSAGTPFDFSQPNMIRDGINSDHEQIQIGGGYDHNIVLDLKEPGLSLAASVFDSNSGRMMHMYTEEPGVQFYTGNFLDGSIIGKDGKSYGKQSALCLETQHYPDSPNKSNFPSPILQPGERYETTTVYEFTVFR